MSYELKSSTGFTYPQGGDVLQPILVAGYGRSGTTAVMNLLATAPQIAFDRAYPYENRYLSYFAKLASIFQNRPPDERFTTDHLYTFEESIFGPLPWTEQMSEEDVDWLPIFWQLFSWRAKNTNPTANFYAEKAPVWLTAMVRQSLPCSVIHLFRDPRDVYLSANAFMKARSYYSFHRVPGQSDLEHARSLGLELVNYFENFVWDSMHETGSYLLRYEDFVADPESFSASLRSLGVATETKNAFEHIEMHRTSSSLSASVGRWRNENIPSDICSFFERHLGREMKALGYPVSTTDLCPSVEFRTGEVLPQLTNATHGRIEVNEFAAAVHLMGDDFGFLLPFGPIQADDVSEIWVSVRGNAGEHVSLYWSVADSGFSEERSIHLNYIPGLHWRVVRFRAFEHPLWKGTIQQLRIDLFNGRLRQADAVGHVRWVRLIS